MPTADPTPAALGKLACHRTTGLRLGTVIEVCPAARTYILATEHGEEAVPAAIVALRDAEPA